MIRLGMITLPSVLQFSKFVLYRERYPECASIRLRAQSFWATEVLPGRPQLVKYWD